MVLFTKPKYSRAEQRKEFASIGRAVDRTFTSEPKKEKPKDDTIMPQTPTFLAERTPGKRDKKSKFLFD